MTEKPAISGDALGGQGLQQVQVVGDQGVLGDQGERMAGLGHDLDQLPGQAQPALDWLVGIGVDAQRDRAGLVAGPCQFLAQQLRRIGLGQAAGLEVQPRRLAQIGMRGPRETVRAAVLAAAVGIDRLGEGNVRRLVAADDAARGFLKHLGPRQHLRELLGFRRVPAIVHALVDRGLETARQAPAGSAALDRCALDRCAPDRIVLDGCVPGRIALGRGGHGPIVARLRLSGGDSA